MGRKNIAKLVPIKKNVIDKRNATPIERTYYINPNKDKKKDKTAAPEGDAAKSGKKNDSTKSTKDTKSKNKDISTTNTKSTDKDGKLSSSDEVLKPKSKGKDKDGTINLDEIETFDDFAKQGVDPKAAQQLFCNM